MSKRKQIELSKLRRWQSNFNYLLNIGVNRIKWKNLPQEINPRVIERLLIQNGFVIFFKDEIADMYGILGGALSGEYDKYGVPTASTVIGLNNNYTKECDIKNSVIIYDNYIGSNTLDYTYYYANELTECDLSRKMNIFQQRFPYLFKSTKEQQLVMKSIFKKIEDYEPVVFADSTLNADTLSCINLNTPYVADKLTVMRNNLINEYLTILGIENTNMDKKERMIVDEVNGNYGLLEVNRLAFLNPRNDAVKEINDKFNLNIEVEYASDLVTMLNKPYEFEKTEVTT